MNGSILFDSVLYSDPDYEREERLRLVSLWLGIALTWFTRYRFLEELIFILAKPFLCLPLPLDTNFVCTQSTEAFPTYVATSVIACSYFVFPLLSHHFFDSYCPHPCDSDSGAEQWMKCKRIYTFSLFLYVFILLLTFFRVIPPLWDFLYSVGASSSLMLKLQPRIYDYVMLTVRVLFVTAICSQVPVIVIRLPEWGGLSLQTFMNNRRHSLFLPLMGASISAPPDVWCQIVARLLISSVIELVIFVALIFKVRQRKLGGKGSMGGRLEKKRSSPLTNNSRPTNMIHYRKEREQDE